MIMTDVIKAGDVVRLKCGGPKMTAGKVSLSNISKVEEVDCYWFDSSGMRHMVVPASALEVE